MVCMKENVNSVLGIAPSFGFGDRLGIATRGHCLALQKYGKRIHGIFAQQSIREMSRTNRTPLDVMNDAENGLRGLDFDELRGADADHLKTKADVDYVFPAGFSFFTIDPSDHVDNLADQYSDDQVLEKFESLTDKPNWVQQILGYSVELDINETLVFDEISLKRCALKYGKAVSHSIELGQYIVSVGQQNSRDVEIELSIDETDQPTTAIEH